MDQVTRFECSKCGVSYGVPPDIAAELEGKAACCAGCGRWWVPVPASDGPPVKLEKGRPARALIRLQEYLEAAPAPAAAPKAVPAPAAGEEPEPLLAPPELPSVPAPDAASARASAVGGATASIAVPVVEAPSLRVVVSGPDTDLRGVFDLGATGYLIGRQGCHVNLAQASIPERAIRIRAAELGFTFEGLSGFQIPVGPVSVLSGAIDAGRSVKIELPPYELVLETSATPGSPIPDLEEAPRQPPEEPVEQAVTPQERPTVQRPATPTDIRHMMQEVAVDVQPDQQPFEEPGGGGPPQTFDGDMTLADIGARGFQAMRMGDPLKGLDLQLVRTEGPAAGRVFKVTKSPIVIGRSEGDLLIRDRRVSGKHAQLDITGAQMYTLKDLASTNGTTINGRPVSIAPLQNGDVIGFGGVTFKFEVRLDG